MHCTMVHARDAMRVHNSVEHADTDRLTREGRGGKGRKECMSSGRRRGSWARGLVGSSLFARPDDRGSLEKAQNHERAFRSLSVISLTHPLSHLPPRSSSTVLRLHCVPIPIYRGVYCTPIAYRTGTRHTCIHTCILLTVGILASDKDTVCSVCTSPVR